jgi:S-adenosylmethionine:tRNA-ribosyltransferase-isomerase (queuine synthetase)
MSASISRPYTLADFDFALPGELIAQHPSPCAARRACSMGRGERHRPGVS